MAAPVSAILLAAGESTRMGTQKALVEWHGMTLLEYQLSQLAAVDAISEIIVVTGHDPARIAAVAAECSRALVAHNAGYQTGKVSSILVGLRAISSSVSDILLLAVDQPRSSDIHRALIEAHDTSDALITVPVHGGRRGHPVLFARALLPELLEIVEATQGVRAVTERHDAATNVVAIDDPSVLLDLNTPLDLRRSASL